MNTTNDIAIFLGKQKGIGSIADFVLITILEQNNGTLSTGTTISARYWMPLDGCYVNGRQIYVPDGVYRD